MEVAHAPSSGIPTVARTAASPRKPPSPKRLANRVAKGSPRSAARDPSHHTKTSKSGRPNIAPRPLVPFTERKSVDDRGSRKPSKDADGLDKSDVIPDGGSAGREGRQFTVAKVGNNGRLYLRYARCPNLS